jgi:hypothetical protein
MGGIASGIFNLVAGDPAKKEEGQLGDLGNFETGVGQKGTNASLGYDLGILSGDPSKIAETLSPEISAQNKEVEQGKLTAAEFGNRSGGTNAHAQAMDDAARGNIINLIGGLQQGAAQHAGNLGTYDLSMAAPNFNSVAALKTAGQNRKAGAIGGIAQGAAEILAGLPMGAAGGAGMDLNSFSDLLQGGQVAHSGLESALTEPDYALNMGK